MCMKYVCFCFVFFYEGQKRKKKTDNSDYTVNLQTIFLPDFKKNMIEQ